VTGPKIYHRVHREVGWYPTRLLVLVFLAHLGVQAIAFRGGHETTNLVQGTTVSKLQDGPGLLGNAGKKTCHVPTQHQPNALKENIMLALICWNARSCNRKKKQKVGEEIQNIHAFRQDSVNERNLMGEPSG
jgi:hypothetical protein